MPRNENIEKNFTYHTPKEGQSDIFVMIREHGKTLAYCIENNVPDSREKSLALTKIEEAIMWANAGVVRN